MKNKLLLTSILALHTAHAFATDFFPQSLTLLAGNYNGKLSDLSAKDDLKILNIYSSRKGKLDARFAIPYTGGSITSVEIKLSQETSANVFIFQIKNSAGSFIEIGRTSGNAGVMKNLVFDLTQKSLSSSGSEFRIVQSGTSSVDDIQVDYLSLKNTSESAPEPTPTPTPAPMTSSVPAGSGWYWQLQGVINTSINKQYYDIDLFDTSASVISDLKTQGKKVICYFSAGSYENWRPDAAKFPAIALGKNLDGWAGERWLDVRNSTVRQIMADRMVMAKQKGCDGVEPDNVDGYQNDSGFPLSAADQISFNKALAASAHSIGLVVALKNSTDLVSSLVADFDFAVVEECFKYNECEAYSPFIQNHKAVFNAEYTSYSDLTCQKAKSLGFSTAFYNLNLDGKVFRPCDP